MRDKPGAGGTTHPGLFGLRLPSTRSPHPGWTAGWQSSSRARGTSQNTQVVVASAPCLAGHMRACRMRERVEGRLEPSGPLHPQAQQRGGGHSGDRHNLIAYHCFEHPSHALRPQAMHQLFDRRGHNPETEGQLYPGDVWLGGHTSIAAHHALANPAPSLWRGPLTGAACGGVREAAVSSSIHNNPCGKRRDSGNEFVHDTINPCAMRLATAGNTQAEARRAFAVAVGHEVI